MKLAEALALRGTLDTQIKDLRERAKSSARFLKDEEPPESANDLIAETRNLIREHAILVTRINHTNAATELEPGLTLTAALAQRNRHSQEAALLKAIAEEASPSRDPYGRRRRATELPEKTDLDVKNLHHAADVIAKRHRELDALIQQAGWTTDLI